MICLASMRVELKTFCREVSQEKLGILFAETDPEPRRPAICEGYEAKDIFNADENGLFSALCQLCTMVAKGKSCSGRKPHHRAACSERNRQEAEAPGAWQGEEAEVLLRL